ncbi:MAG: hypothetical protein ABJA80_14910 [bacterium]
MAEHYFLRKLSHGEGDVGSIVYVAVSSDGLARDARQDPVRVYAGFPLGWRPTENPGEALHDHACREQYWFCELPRKSFRHYARIEQEDALRLYPGLRDMIRDERGDPTAETASMN